MSQYRIETKCLQEGYQPRNGEPRALPIVQSTTYKYDSAEYMGQLFDLEAEGYFYSRLANPTVSHVENKLAALEGGVGAMLTSSGQAASMLSLLNICSNGDHVVCSSTLYGGTFNLFDVTMRKMGIDFTFVDPDCSDEELNAAFRPNTKAVFGESLANPALVVLDIRRFAKAAHAQGVPLIVDNTFPTPMNCRPFEFGADIVIHSTTKYLDGHGVALGGAIVDSGNFDWENGNFPGLATPDPSYHGVVYTRQFGKAAYIVKARVHLMRDIGPMMTPGNAFLLNLGMETLHLRMRQHCSNALAVAEFLQQSDRVSWVRYPGLVQDKYYQMAQEYMPGGTCGVITFGVVGGREAAVRFMDNLKLALIVTHVADAKTCVLHPASTTHRQMDDEALTLAGVSPDLIRLSVGIEHEADIIEDIQQALEKSK